MKFWQTLKLVIISIVALVGITFLTVEPPQKIEKKQIDLQNLPKSVELIGYENQEFATKSIIKKRSVIFVGNSQTIVLANSLYEMLELPIGEFVIVSNISDAPWFIKRWQAHTQNTKLKGSAHLPWIYDRDGKIRNFLQVPTSDAVKYFIYKVNDEGIVKKIYNGEMKNVDMEKEFSEKEMKGILKEAVSIIKNTNN
jgi:hypothetical protein